MGLWRCQRAIGIAENVRVKSVQREFDANSAHRKMVLWNVLTIKVGHMLFVLSIYPKCASEMSQLWSPLYCSWYRRNGSTKVMIRSIEMKLAETEQVIWILFFCSVCYICQENNKGSKASAGACMQCNKSGCKQQFHVTCAQARGLLCEEAGNYLDNVKYCGYCQHHYSKLVCTCNACI